MYNILLFVNDENDDAIDDLYFEIIDFQISCIGGIMCKEIKKGGTVRW